MSDPSENPGVSRRRRKTKSYALLVLAAGIFLFGAAAGGLYFALRPGPLPLALGPPGSDDHKLIVALAQTFAREGGPVRLSPITTQGAAERTALLARSKTDLAGAA